MVVIMQNSVDFTIHSVSVLEHYVLPCFSVVCTRYSLHLTTIDKTVFIVRIPVSYRIQMV